MNFLELWLVLFLLYAVFCCKIHAKQKFVKFVRDGEKHNCQIVWVEIHDCKLEFAICPSAILSMYCLHHNHPNVSNGFEHLVSIYWIIYFSYFPKFSFNASNWFKIKTRLKKAKSRSCSCIFTFILLGILGIYCSFILIPFHYVIYWPRERVRVPMRMKASICQFTLTFYTHIRRQIICWQF